MARTKNKLNGKQETRSFLFRFYCFYTNQIWFFFSFNFSHLLQNSIWNILIKLTAWIQPERFSLWFNIVCVEDARGNRIEKFRSRAEMRIKNFASVWGLFWVSSVCFYRLRLNDEFSHIQDKVYVLSQQLCVWQTLNQFIVFAFPSATLSVIIIIIRDRKWTRSSELSLP